MRPPSWICVVGLAACSPAADHEHALVARADAHAALAQVQSDAEQKAQGGAIELTVSSLTDADAQLEVYLRHPSGEVEFGFYGRDIPKRWDALAAGTYDLAVRLPVAHEGPWIYVSAAVVVAPGVPTQVEREAPEGRTARLAVAPDRGSPPFFLALASAGTSFPSSLKAWGERFSQRAYPDDLFFGLMSDGRSGLDRIPALLPGRYTLVWMANDWQTGDPPIEPRTLPIELRAGETTTFILEDKLTRGRVGL